MNSQFHLFVLFSSYVPAPPTFTKVQQKPLNDSLPSTAKQPSNKKKQKPVKPASNNNNKKRKKELPPAVKQKEEPKKKEKPVVVPKTSATGDVRSVV